MRRLLVRILACRRGATALEYAFVAALICLAVLASISVVGSRTLGLWNNVSAAVPIVQGRA